MNLSNACIDEFGASELSAKLADFIQLTRLDLSDNELGDAGAINVCSSLGKLSALTSVDLRLNHISTTGWQAVNEAISGLTALEEINGWAGYGQLQRGELAELAAGNLLVNHFVDPTILATVLRLSCGTLTGLDLSSNDLGFNGIVALGTALEHLQMLTQMNLSSNALGAEAGLILGKALSNLLKLQDLNVSLNNLGDKGMTAIAPSLGLLLMLTRLELSSNSMTKESASIMSNALEKLSKLQDLNVGILSGQDGISSEAFASRNQLDPSVIQSCWHFSNLLRLNISGFQLKGEWLEGLGHFGSSGLKELDLSENSLGENNLKYLSLALADCKSITKLDLRSCALHPNSADGLYSLLAHQPVLRELHLGCQISLVDRNMLNAENIKFIFTSLQNLSCLTVLDLGVNDLGVDGMQELTVPMQRMTNLTFLNLRICKISSAGAEELASVLGFLTRITSIDLSHNKIGPNGGKALAGALERLQRISRLEICNNKLGEEGVKLISSALEHLQGIKQLNIRFLFFTGYAHF
mmetsp:Transcript_58759/g.155459  ORF Transcript_58759/g.155459 Transcript_58759/m.155459 type:complete len:526 (-) Transcript_58759:1198-2775(-)